MKKDEMEKLMNTMKNFMDWIESEMKERKTKTFNFKLSWVINMTNGFCDEYITTFEEIEKGYYQLKKKKYLLKLEEWNKMIGKKRRIKKWIKKEIKRKEVNKNPLYNSL
jgi:hypothetical protein